MKILSNAKDTNPEWKGNFVCEHCHSVLEVSESDINIWKSDFAPNVLVFTFICPVCEKINDAAIPYDVQHRITKRG